MLRLSRPGKDEDPKLSASLISALGDLYREAQPGPFRDELAGTLYRVAPGTEAVVLAGSGCCEGPRFSGCCDVLNFFETRDNAERYLRNNPSVSGSMPSSRSPTPG